MIGYCVNYVTSGIFNKLTNLAKLTGFIYYNDFHIFPIDERVSVSSLPREDYKAVVNRFKVIISFMHPSEYGLNQIDWIKNSPKFKHYNVPVYDYSAPSHEDYKQLFKILDTHPHEKILIHCYAGKGRSNCGVAAYLMHRHKLSAQKAIALVEKKNPRSSMNSWQKESLHLLEKNMKQSH